MADLTVTTDLGCVFSHGTRQMPRDSRLGEPAEVACLIVEIGRNSYLNGETIRLDSGIRMPPQIGDPEGRACFCFPTDESWIWRGWEAWR